MPIALNKKRTVTLRLKTEKDLPEAEQSAFVVHFLTADEAAEIKDLRSKAVEAPDDQATAEHLNAALKLALCGWTNVADRDGQAIPFPPERFSKFLTIDEMYELVLASVVETTMTEIDLKKLPSPSPIALANAAPAVPPAV